MPAATRKIAQISQQDDMFKSPAPKIPRFEKLAPFRFPVDSWQHLLHEHPVVSPIIKKHAALGTPFYHLGRLGDVEAIEICRAHNRKGVWLDVFEGAASHGQMDVLEWILRNHTLFPPFPLKLVRSTWKSAIEHRRAGLIAFIARHFPIVLDEMRRPQFRFPDFVAVEITINK